MRTRAGFTLVEVMIVIAILMILAAILFPVFVAAKMSAKKVGSASNLRQMFVAVQIYGYDYDDTYAFGIPRFWSDKRHLVRPEISANAAIAPLLEDQLITYGVTEEVAHSPGDPGMNGYRVFEEYRTSYSFRLTTFLTPKTMTSYDDPANLTLGHEARTYYETDFGGESRRMALYMDGHVKYVTWVSIALRMEE